MIEKHREYDFMKMTEKLKQFMNITKMIMKIGTPCIKLIEPVINFIEEKRTIKRFIEISGVIACIIMMAIFFFIFVLLELYWSILDL